MRVSCVLLVADLLEQRSPVNLNKPENNAGGGK
jgi:hypothetical protein